MKRDLVNHLILYTGLQIFHKKIFRKERSKMAEGRGRKKAENFVGCLEPFHVFYEAFRQALCWKCAVSFFYCLLNCFLSFFFTSYPIPRNAYYSSLGLAGLQLDLKKKNHIYLFYTSFSQEPRQYKCVLTTQAEYKQAVDN